MNSLTAPIWGKLKHDHFAVMNYENSKNCRNDGEENEIEIETGE